MGPVKAAGIPVIWYGGIIDSPYYRSNSEWLAEVGKCQLTDLGMMVI